MDNQEAKEKILSIFRGVLGRTDVEYHNEYTYSVNDKVGITRVRYHKNKRSQRKSQLVGPFIDRKCHLTNMEDFEHTDVCITVDFKEGDPSLKIRTKLETVSEVKNELVQDYSHELPFWKLLFGKKEVITFHEVVSEYVDKFTISFGEFEFEITKEEAEGLYLEVVEGVKITKEALLNERFEKYGNKG